MADVVKIGPPQFQHFLRLPDRVARLRPAKRLMVAVALAGDYHKVEQGQVEWGIPEIERFYVMHAMARTIAHGGLQVLPYPCPN